MHADAQRYARAKFEWVTYKYKIRAYKINFILMLLMQVLTQSDQEFADGWKHYFR